MRRSAIAATFLVAISLFGADGSVEQTSQGTRPPLAVLITQTAMDPTDDCTIWYVGD